MADEAPVSALPVSPVSPVVPVGTVVGGVVGGVVVPVGSVVVVSEPVSPLSSLSGLQPRSRSVPIAETHKRPNRLLNMNVFSLCTHQVIKSVVNA